MRFYGYKGSAKLGSERLGSENKILWSDLKTIKGAHRRATKIFGKGGYTLYTFTNLYDDSTYVSV